MPQWAVALAHKQITNAGEFENSNPQVKYHYVELKVNRFITPLV